MTDHRKVSIAPVAFAGAAIIVASYVSLRRKREEEEPSLPFPPTPPTRHWFLGHAEAIYDKENGRSHDVMCFEWMQKLGSKIVRFELPFGHRLIAVADPDAVKYIVQTKNFRKSPTYGMMGPIIGRRSILSMEGKQWSTERRRYNPGFSHDFLQNVVGTISQKCGRLLSRCDTDAHVGRCTNTHQLSVDLTSDVIAQVAFGEDWGVGVGRGTLNIIRDLVREVGFTMTNPLRKIDFRNRLRMKRLSRALDADMERLVQRRIDLLKAYEDGSVSHNSNDILTLTISGVIKDKDCFELSPDEMEAVVSQLKTFYFAGHDTTATTIAWAIWLLAQHPDSLEKVMNELEREIGEWVASLRKKKKPSKLDGGPSTTDDIEEIMSTLPPPSFERLQKCSYLDAVINETLRLYPPAASTRYVANSNESFGGYKLDRSFLHICIYALHRDPDYWDAPDAFRPERFLGQEGERAKGKYCFLPFSRGPRDCIGKYFAMLEIKIVLASIFSRYGAVAVDPNEVYSAVLTNRPKNGCKVHLRFL